MVSRLPAVCWLSWLPDRKDGICPGKGKILHASTNPIRVRVGADARAAPVKNVAQTELLPVIRSRREKPSGGLHRESKSIFGKKPIMIEKTMQERIAAARDQYLREIKETEIRLAQRQAVIRAALPSPMAEENPNLRKEAMQLAQSKYMQERAEALSRFREQVRQALSMLMQPVESA